MIPYKPYRLGQTFTSGITSELARKIVEEAEPATRRIISDERSRLADALIGGIPLAALSAAGFAATTYLIPETMKTGKFIGYIASAAALAGSAFWVVNELREEAPAAPAAPAEPGPFQGVVTDAAQKIVQEAEPRIRQIVQDEKTRAVEAAKAGLPLAIGSLVALLATIFLVDPEKKALKTLGLTGSAALLGAGAWIALEKEKAA